MSTFFIWVALTVAGFMMIWKAEWILQNFGRIDWAEEKLGTSGGTRLFWKLFGLAIIAGAFLHLFGFWGSILDGIFGSLFRRPQ